MSDRRLLGALALCAGIFMFSIQDAIIKGISGAYAVTLAVALRSVAGVPVSLLILHFDGGLRALATPHLAPILLRAGILYLSYTTYYIAFPALPLAEAVALYFTTPLIVTALAGPVLGETVGWRAWAAVCVGLAGVIVMLQPGSALFEPAALLSLISAFLYGASMLMARRLGAVAPASVMAFHQNWVYLAGACVTAAVFHLAGLHEAGHPSLDFLMRAWTMPTPVDMGLMALCGVIAAIGTTLLTQAYRVAQANFVTPFEYSGLLWAPLWGFLFWSEIPRATTVIGAGLIILAGLIATTRKPA